MTTRAPDTELTEDLIDTICTRLAEGESLRSICLDDDMPARSTVFLWLLKEREGGLYAKLSDQYVRARELQADAHADEIQDIADDGSNDWMEKHDKDGNSIGWVINGEAVQRSKLRVDARKWTASKLRPKKYGEKLDLTSGGEKLALASAVSEGRKRLANLEQKDDTND